MTRLEAELTKVLQPGMRLPEPLKLLYSWIEANGHFVDRPNGERVGFLFPQNALRAGWTDTERPGGTIIEFLAEGNEHLHHWFGHRRGDVLGRLCVFAKTGADGSMAALWLDDEGRQLIVHLGSGSGSLTTCVLASDPVDFLRLLAIGYDELCWGSNFAEPPNSAALDASTYVHPNQPFQRWVRETFNVTIPETGSEIVKSPDDMGEPDSFDAFNRWVQASAA